MDIKYLDFARNADRLVTDPSNRGRILATAVGIALASKLPLPSLQLDISPENYFNTQVGLGAMDYISRFNEEIIFDTRYCREVVRAFWLLRYAAAYPGAQFNAPPTLGFVDSVVGATLYLAPEMHQFCNDHKDAIFALVREALLVIKVTEAAHVGIE
jgi:hypothetical protein